MIKTIVLSGYGLNCEQETAHAFMLAGSKADIVHINDLIAHPSKLKQYQIMTIPGGFSYGDDTGSGNAFASKVKNHLWEEIQSFVQKDKLMIGICNGFQIMVRLGLLPYNKEDNAKDEGVALTHNTSARYIVRWVDLLIKNKSPWLKSIKTISLPIAHGEGKFVASKNILDQLEKKGQIGLSYIKGEMCSYQRLKANPNGSLRNIAGITDISGRLFGLMPHPERAIFFHHLPNWPLLKEKYLRTNTKLPKRGPGLQIFKNAVKYFKMN